jgi:hypothetical protein
MVPAVGLSAAAGTLLDGWVGWYFSQGTSASWQWQSTRDIALIGAVILAFVAWLITWLMVVIRRFLSD